MKNTEIIFCILDELNPIAKKRFLEYALEGKNSRDSKRRKC